MQLIQTMHSLPTSTNYKPEKMTTYCILQSCEGSDKYRIFAVIHHEEKNKAKKILLVKLRGQYILKID